MAGTYAVPRAMQRAAAMARDLLYPPTCLLCDTRVQEEGGLCPACWSQTPFITGAACDLCGVPLPGDDDGVAWCDACLVTPRPWDEGRAALVYAGKGRSLVLSLKHGDRTELARGAGAWMHRSARGLIGPESLILPVPLHRWRLLRRRYNQSALLAQEIARRTGATFDPFRLVRHRETPSQEKKSPDARFANVEGAFSMAGEVAGRHVVLVDDVLTSGATMTACAALLHEAGAARITALVLARVAPGR
jgi:ComF family protein